ncbi:MAG: FkbM family methyltransferase [Candidatus Limnocylindria bacterium]
MLDLGGNIGLFALDTFTEFPEASVTSVEPDPRNLRILHMARAANASKDWAIVGAAASTSAGSLMLEIGDYADTKVSDTGSTEVTSIDVLPMMRDVDLIKIDIEGSEWPILADPRMADVQAPIAMEWHDAGAPTQPAHAAAVSALRAVGFMTQGEEFGYDHGFIWAWRPSSA